MLSCFALIRESDEINPFTPADAWRHSLARHAMCLQVHKYICANTSI